MSLSVSAPGPVDARDGCTVGFISALLVRCGLGDELALGTVFDLFYAPVLGAAMAGDVALRDAEEAVHDAFLTLWREAPTYRPSEGNAVEWIMHHSAPGP